MPRRELAAGALRSSRIVCRGIHDPVSHPSCLAGLLGRGVDPTTTTRIIFLVAAALMIGLDSLPGIRTDRSAAPLMRTERFTQKATEAIEAAQQLAEGEGHAQLEALHLLYALVEQPEGVVPTVLERAGHDPAALAERIREELAKLPKVTGAQLTLSEDARRILSDSHPLAERMHDEYVSTEHLLLTILATQPPSPATRLLAAAGIGEKEVLAALTQIRGSQRVTSENPEATYEALAKYGRDLTDARPRGQARPGHRSRRGDPAGHPGPQPPDEEQPGAHWRAGGRQDGDCRGAGPAHRARRRARGPQGQAGRGPGPGFHGGRGQVPRGVRGTPQGGAQGGHRLRGPDHPVHRRAPHRGRGGRGRRARWTRPTCSSRSSRAASCTASGATTLDEYRKNIEKDAALERRFQPIVVDQPSVEDTISILRGLRERYEVHHGVRITDSALVAAAVLSNRYITERFLPDKAIDLVDESAAGSGWRWTPCRPSWTRWNGVGCSSRSSARRSARRRTPPPSGGSRSSRRSWPTCATSPMS